MMTIDLFISICLMGVLHINRDRIEIPHKYKKTVWFRFSDFQWWLNPRISWMNKKSKYVLWELVKSTVFVFATDLKHLLKTVEFNLVVYSISIFTQVSLISWVWFNIFFGVGVYIGGMNWFGKEE